MSKRVRLGLHKGCSVCLKSNIRFEFDIWVRVTQLVFPMSQRVWLGLRRGVPYVSKVSPDKKKLDIGVRVI